MKKVVTSVIALAIITTAIAFIVWKPTAEDPRRIFARKVVDTLAANNWDHSVFRSFLCDNKIIKEMCDRDKSPVGCEFANHSVRRRIRAVLC